MGALAPIQSHIHWVAETASSVLELAHKLCQNNFLCSFQYWNVVAFTTAEEYDLEKLTKGLLQQNLYLPIPPPRARTDQNQVGKGIIVPFSEWRLLCGL
jgi:hypothetical protein